MNTARSGRMTVAPALVALVVENRRRAGRAPTITEAGASRYVARGWETSGAIERGARPGYLDAGRILRAGQAAIDRAGAVDIVARRSGHRRAPFKSIVIVSTSIT
jgi:hypothetical protein